MLVIFIGKINLNSYSYQAWNKLTVPFRTLSLKLLHLEAPIMTAVHYTGLWGIFCDTWISLGGGSELIHIAFLDRSVLQRETTSLSEKLLYFWIWKYSSLSEKSPSSPKCNLNTPDLMVINLWRAVSDVLHIGGMVMPSGITRFFFLWKEALLHITLCFWNSLKFQVNFDEQNQ